MLNPHTSVNSKRIINLFFRCHTVKEASYSVSASCYNGVKSKFTVLYSTLEDSTVKLITVEIWVWFTRVWLVIWLDEREIWRGGLLSSQNHCIRMPKLICALRACFVASCHMVGMCAVSAARSSQVKQLLHWMERRMDEYDALCPWLTSLWGIALSLWFHAVSRARTVVLCVKWSSLFDLQEGKIIGN